MSYLSDNFPHLMPNRPDPSTVVCSDLDVLAVRREYGVEVWESLSEWHLGTLPPTATEADVRSHYAFYESGVRDERRYVKAGPTSRIKPCYGVS